MFIKTQPKHQTDSYLDLLQRVGSLSGLFSNSSTPYLYYRAAENIFCEAFQADNHSRSDTSADASKNKIGIGLKTFINGRGKSWQKVAEFNKDSKDYKKLITDPEKLSIAISKLRNKRIDFAKSIHDVDEMIYHCVSRSKGKFYLFEEEMHYVDIPKIKILKINENTVHFTDGKEDYNFNITKSTLFKRFITQNETEFDVKIIDNPFEFLKNLKTLIVSDDALKVKEKIILPLYSSTKKEGNFVPEKSGLNQWNAGGRKRDEKEVYIPIPSWIHKSFPNFFPQRGDSFKLKLPNGDSLSAGVFQDGEKALMSNPNKDLGNWLIDRVLKIEPGRIVEYKDLEDVGINSVEIQKIDEQNFEIDFKEVGAFENFELQYK
ncbi:NgoFVII family restriction endonuclease [Patescibacteria group bacterium]|nr:NgoFVII family restriction endonuclease [Patescibacteria group bacterium]